MTNFSDLFGQALWAFFAAYLFLIVFGGIVAIFPRPRDRGLKVDFKNE